MIGLERDGSICHTLSHDGLERGGGDIGGESGAVGVADGGAVSTVGVAATQTDVERPLS